MRLPETINILGITYRIKEVEIVDKNVPSDGEINYQTLEIKIDKSLAEEKKAQILMHEILHGLFDSLGMIELRDDEKAVQSLATALYHLFSTQTIFSS